MVRTVRPLRIRAGRIIDPSAGIDRVADLVLERGLVSVISPVDAVMAAGEQVLEASGMIVCPGFVDLHTHLRYPGFPEKETIESGTAAAAAGGFTTVCAMANTSPPVDSVEVLHDVLNECTRSAHVRVRQLGTVSCGLLGGELADLDALWAAGAVGFSDDGKPVWNAALMEQALRWSADNGATISVHEEDPEIVRGGVANDGDVARRLGLQPWPCAGEARLVARDLALAEKLGGHLHIAHVSCADTVELLRAARDRGVPVTAEVTPHHLSLTEDLLEGIATTSLSVAHPFCKVNPPLRSVRDVEACVDALRDGIIGAVATDHAPHTHADKDTDFDGAAFGFSAIETALPLALENVHSGRISIGRLIECLTCGPASIFGLDAGSLRVGTPADVCVFDPDEPWRVTPDSLYSRGKNTPLMQNVLRGRVAHTIVGGNIIFARERGEP